MSSRKGSSKKNSSSHSSSGDSSANEVIALKEEFEVEEEAKDAYYKALCGSPPLSQDISIPKRPVRSPNTPLTPSMVSLDYLTTLWDFYQIPGGVVFRIPNGNESAKNPPEGFFTCYEAFLVYCRMCFRFLVPSSALHHFGLSISQLSVPALQHWLGVLILSYELGMDLNPSDFEGFWFARGTGIDGSYRMAPKKGMTIIQGHTSHPKASISKRNSSSHSSLGDSSANEVIAPKEEFEVEEEAKDAYYKALCGSPPPSQDIPIPKRPSAKNHPEGFFTCDKAFLVYYRMLFPIPGTIVRALRHFGLSISQLSVPALQHWLSMLISSYELGMDRNPGDSEGWCQRRMGSLSRRATSTYSVGSGTSPVDPSVDSCRSFCQARSSPQQAVLLEFLHRRTDLKRGGAPSISSHLSASGRSV
ncbi:hypothetical protein F2Q69_00042318 [Brassica cretica]|uniref:Uncharacterized protein n=1 Tax=Brassica cretica TaxID=69181 RepID=A0A8S9NED3_BRACR|nr:hypothetical protein F2Q69_00042318 [Brassica cretica]